MKHSQLILVALSCICLSCGESKKSEAPPLVDPPGGPIPNLPIEQPPPAPPIEGQRLDVANFEQFILNDLNSLPQREQRRSRYLSVCNFKNTDPDIELDRKLEAANKFVNSISKARNLTRVAEVEDSFGCIYRLDLDDIGALPEEWAKFEKVNLLPIVSDSTRGRTIRALTQTNQPYVIFQSMIASFGGDELSINNGIYYDFLNQPADNREFFESIGVDLNELAEDSEIMTSSGPGVIIAQSKSRLTTLVVNQDISLLSTYDVDLGDQDATQENPFTVEQAVAGGVLRTDKIFIRNVNVGAQEHFYLLDNGMYGHRLNNIQEIVVERDQNGILRGFADGFAEEVAPNSVVQHTSMAAFNGEGVSNAINLMSCFSCHGQQMAIPFRDQVGSIIQRSANFSAVEKELGAIFYNQTRYAAKGVEINERWKQTLEQIGVDPELPDPINSEILNPIRREQTLEQVASLFFLSPDELVTIINGSLRVQAKLGQFIQEGERARVNFADLVDVFPLVIADGNLFRDEDI